MIKSYSLTVPTVWIPISQVIAGGWYTRTSREEYYSFFLAATKKLFSPLFLSFS